jgi:pimeloyl-ACP methyl ester carboxylesterase
MLLVYTLSYTWGGWSAQVSPATVTGTRSAPEWKAKSVMPKCSCSPRADTRDDATCVPAWFSKAIAVSPARAVVTCDAVPIHYRAWPAVTTADKPGLVLVHGNAAQSSWWDHLAPILASDRQVVALDLSGHGDSGRRERYDVPRWSREVRAVAAAAGLWPGAILIGHSLGGMVAFGAARQAGHLAGGVIMIDSLIVKRTAEDKLYRHRRAEAPPRIYADRSAALGAYRPRPTQSDVLQYIRAHIAETAIRPVDDGWTWKSDPVIYARPDLSECFLADVEAPLALLYGEYGLIDAAMLATMRRRLGPAADFRVIPGAGHHIMLDKPRELTTTICEVITGWSPPT